MPRPAPMGAPGPSVGPRAHGAGGQEKAKGVGARSCPRGDCLPAQQPVPQIPGGCSASRAGSKPVEPEGQGGVRSWGLRFGAPPCHGGFTLPRPHSRAGCLPVGFAPAEDVHSCREHEHHPSAVFSFLWGHAGRSAFTRAALTKPTCAQISAAKSTKKECSFILIPLIYSHQMSAQCHIKIFNDFKTNGP